MCRLGVRPGSLCCSGVCCSRSLLPVPCFRGQLEISVEELVSQYFQQYMHSLKGRHLLIYRLPDLDIGSHRALPHEDGIVQHQEHSHESDLPWACSYIVG